MVYCWPLDWKVTGVSYMPILLKRQPHLLLVLSMLLLNGCATLDRLEKDQLTQLKQGLTAQPQEDVLMGSLADEYSEQYRQSIDLQTLDAQIERQLNILKSDPDDVRANLTAYDLLSTRAVQTGNINDIQQLRMIFTRPVVKSQPMLSPPSLVEAMLYLQKPQVKNHWNKVTQLCRAAIRENEQHGEAYLILSRLHVQNNRLDLAAALLEKASQKTGPGNAAILTELANVYVLRLNAQRCRGDTSIVQQSVKFNELALRNSPDDPSLSENLALIYRIMNQPERSLYYAKHRSKLENSLRSREDLADGYMFAGSFEQAQQILQNILLENNHNASTWERLGIVYFTRSEWQKAFDAFSNARRYQQVASVNNTLRYAISAHMIGRASYARSLIKQRLAGSDMNRFERGLLEYYQRKKTQAELISIAENFCDKTKAYYFIAMHSLMANQAEQAANHFKKVLLLNDYGSRQYVGAKHILQVLAE